MKTATIIHYRSGFSGTSETSYSGTVEELTKVFAYKLEVGASWAHEKGNKKINTEPKTFKSLLTNLNNAAENAGSNDTYELI